MASPSLHRIVVVGPSGVGKTTLARAVSEKLDLPYTEIDALFHGPDWRPRDSFLDDVRTLAAGDRWITEWQYDPARPILADRATTMVWLDYPWPIQMSRAIRRTVRRRLRREELWNGNREGSLLGIFTDDEHIIRWAWHTRHKFRELPEQLAVDHPHLAFIRLRSQREADRWLASL